MFNAEEIREKIRQTKEMIRKLTGDKEKQETERKKGENLLEQYKTLKKQMITQRDTYEENLRKRAAELPGHFGQHYQEEVLSIMRQNGSHSIEDGVDNVISSIKDKLLNLDDVIEELVNKLKEKESFLEELKKKLESVVEAIEDIIPGGN